MVFQSYAVWPHRSVLDNVAYPLEVRGMDKRARDEKAKGALSMVHMEHLAARMPAALSGGQQQRVASPEPWSINPLFYYWMNL